MTDEPIEEPTALTPEIVEDDQTLAAWVDAITQADPVARARATEIVERWEWLRQSADADIWSQILGVEETIVERWADLLVVVARLSFESGRRFPTTTKEGSS